MVWQVIVGAAISAISSIASGRAQAGAVDDASRRSTDVTLQMYNQSRADLGPYRQAGYAALDQLSQLYGLGGGGGGGGGGVNTVGSYGGLTDPTQDPTREGLTNFFDPAGLYGGGNGSAWNLVDAFGARNDPKRIIDPLGLFSGQDVPHYSYNSQTGRVEIDGWTKKNVRGGYIDPITGEVVVHQIGTSNVDPTLSAQATEFLRTGEGTLDPSLGRFGEGINALRSGGWTYNPGGSGGAAGAAGAAPSATRDLSAFYKSPDYEFRRSEGLRDINNSYAARGGAASGPAMRGAIQYSGDLAAGSFNTYVDRLMGIAGLGGSATSQGVNAAQNTGANLTNIYTNQGNARASAYGGMYGGVNSSIQGGLGNWMLYDYMRKNPQAGG